MIAFVKVEGLGNDFVLVEAEAVREILDAAWVQRVCDRHRGVGADGVLVVDAGARPRMQVWNADGSRPEMCGNGLRCVALELARRGQRARFEVETDAGPHACEVRLDADRRGAQVRVEMRAPSFAPEAIPIAHAGPLLDGLVQLGERAVRVSAVSMGNPHAVVFEDLDPDLAPALQRHRVFPQQANVGLAQARADGGFDLRVFERGVGWTEACGTGACAAAAAAVETGRARRHEPIGVHLPGGELVITVGEPGATLRMEGRARLVFEGRLP